MDIYNPPFDCDADDDEAPQVIPGAISNVTCRVTDTEDALAELVRVTLIHTSMLKNLQAANDTLSQHLEATTMRLNQMEVELRALQDAQVVNFLPGDKSHVDEAIIDQQLFLFSPEGHRQDLVNHFTTDSIRGYDSSHWMDMSNIATTLAIAPQIPASASSASLRSSSSSQRERRSSKPHREEHVKRSRITYDGNGGQTPSIAPTSLTLTIALDEIQQAYFPDNSSTQSVNESEFSSDNGEEDAECDGPAERSLTSWLYGKATKALFRQ